MDYLTEKVLIMEDKVTEIQVIPVKPKDGLVGFANFVFDRSFYFSSVGIYTRPHGGYRLTYPTKNNLQLFHPIDKSIAEHIEKVVSDRFEQIQNVQ